MFIIHEYIVLLTMNSKLVYLLYMYVKMHGVYMYHTYINTVYKLHTILYNYGMNLGYMYVGCLKHRDSFGKEKFKK